MIKDSIYIQSLEDYIKDVKPYSSKLVDVAVEYVFDEILNVVVTDAHTIHTKTCSEWTHDFTYDGKTTTHQLPISTLTDRLFFSFSDYNTQGSTARNSVGAVLNNVTAFVPYTRSVPPQDLNGAYNVDPTLGGSLTENQQDPADSTDGIVDFSVNPKGMDPIVINPYTSVDFFDDTHIVASVDTDAYGVRRYTTADVARRTGTKIGTLLQRSAAPGAPYNYVFEFNQQYLDDNVPVGTLVTIHIAQRNSWGDTARVKIMESFFFGQAANMKDNLIFRITNPRLIGGYDIDPGYDTLPYDTVVTEDWVYPTGGNYDYENYDTAGYDSPIIDLDAIAASVASRMSETLHVRAIPTDASDPIEIITLNMPNSYAGMQIDLPITNATIVMINHNCGDVDPLGPYANQGGVIVSITGGTPTGITNPYEYNSPALFTTTKITFAVPTTGTIRIIKP